MSVKVRKHPPDIVELNDESYARKSIWIMRVKSNQNIMGAKKAFALLASSDQHPYGKHSGLRSLLEGGIKAYLKLKNGAVPLHPPLKDSLRYPSWRSGCGTLMSMIRAPVAWVLITRPTNSTAYS